MNWYSFVVGFASTLAALGWLLSLAAMMWIAWEGEP